MTAADFSMNISDAWPGRTRSMAKTKIEWADATWNPITGCTPVSEACDHCYARRMAHRLAGRYGYSADDPLSVTFHRDRLDEPLKWKKPRRVFVCSMGDLFHDDVTDDHLREIFEIMRRSDHHTYQILTKRPQRMRDFILQLQAEKGPDFRRWPLPFVWIGVTAENQARANERIPILLKTPAAVRFVSVEPMLGLVNLEKAQCTCPWPEDAAKTRHLLDCPADQRPIKRWGIDWVICGGETGPGARPVHPDWVRSLRDQCSGVGVPFFFKGWGDWLPLDHARDFSGDGNVRSCIAGDGSASDVGLWRKVGKKHSGSLLDGREWNEFPVGAQ
jgi:protein gp37